MATRAKKISVTVTAGRNAAVDNVLRLEDLLRQMTAAVPKPARGKAPAGAAPGAPADALRQLATDLEARLREARAAAARPAGRSSSPGPAGRSARPPAKDR
jgi:hypothetical protein